MTVDVLLLLTSLAVILVACEVFTNAIEWLGHRLHVAEGAVGSLLAAVGTALPETLIPLVAILFSSGDSQRHQVGIGAILGAPFMLATLAMFVNGVALVGFSRTRGRSREMNIDSSVIGRDLVFFLIVFSLATGVSFVSHEQRWARGLIAVSLAVIYCLYVYRTLVHGGKVQGASELPPLHFSRRTAEPGLPVIVTQVLVSLAAIVFGAHLFVLHVTTIAAVLHIPVLVLSLIIAPIATELPEKFNSVLWVRQGKDTLALGNLTGAMVFQSSIPPAIGICLTKWQLEPAALAAVLLTILSTCVLVASMRLKGKLTASILLCCGLFYVAYLVALTALGCFAHG